MKIDPKEFDTLNKCRKLKGKVTALFLCKKELFYHIPGKRSKNSNISIYPVSYEAAQDEAEFFDVELTEI